VNQISNSEDDEEYEDFSPELAKITLARHGASRAVLVEEHASSYKWLLASLLTLNSGGLFGVVTAEQPPAQAEVLAVLFWIGIVCALGVAWRGQVVTRKFIAKLSELELIYALASIYGNMQVRKADKVEKELSAMTGWSVKAFGWISVVSFSAALFLAVFG